MASIIEQINWIGRGERADSVTANRPLLQFIAKYENGDIVLESSGLSVKIPTSTFDATVNDGDFVVFNYASNKVEKMSVINKNYGFIGVADKTNGKIYIDGQVPTTLLQPDPNAAWYYLRPDGTVTFTYENGAIKIGAVLNNSLVLSRGSNASTFNGLSSSSFLRSDAPDIADSHIEFKGGLTSEFANLQKDGNHRFQLAVADGNILRIASDTDNNTTFETPVLEIRNNSTDALLYGKRILTTDDAFDGSNLNFVKKDTSDTLTGLQYNFKDSTIILEKTGAGERISLIYNAIADGTRCVAHFGDDSTYRISYFDTLNNANNVTSLNINHNTLSATLFGHKIATENTSVIWQKPQIGRSVNIPYNANTQINFQVANNFEINATGALTLTNPQNLAASKGQVGQILITTNGAAVVFGTSWVASVNAEPVGTKCLISYYINDGKVYYNTLNF